MMEFMVRVIFVCLICEVIDLVFFSFSAPSKELENLIRKNRAMLHRHNVASWRRRLRRAGGVSLGTMPLELMPLELGSIKSWLCGNTRARRAH